MNALDHGKVESRPRAWCRSLCTGVSTMLGYLQFMGGPHIHLSDSLCYKVILCDRSVDVLRSYWRYKGLTFCHLTFSFDS